jgi:hypothetical protein
LPNIALHGAREIKVEDVKAQSEPRP